MIRPRIIPCLLLRDRGFYKTVRFKNPKYLGDPINILRIFNEKEVDEITILDIGATLNGREPNFEFLKELASECFMPLAYGGGVQRLEQIVRLLELGIEKVVLNTAAIGDPALIEKAASLVGSQSIVVSIDVKKNLFGRHEVVTSGARQRTGLLAEKWATEVERRGAGEILLNAVDRDGMMDGYDLKLVRAVSNAVSIPVVACGGAGSVEHIREVLTEGAASAAAAGSFFVYTGPYRAVLINVPARDELQNQVFSYLPQSARRY